VQFIETPENKNCGIVKPLTIFARVSIEAPSEDPLLYVCFQQFGVTPVSTVYDHIMHSVAPVCRHIWIYVNERCIGSLDPDKTQRLSSYLKANRWLLMGESYLSVVNCRKTNSLRLFTDSGRIVSPLFVVKNLLRLLSPCSVDDPTPLLRRLTWDEMLAGNFIQFIDKKEEDNDLFIAMNLNDLIKIFQQFKHDPNKIASIPWTHVEIHPVLILGFCASQIPLSNHNQNPRNV
jgi:DNA-directed RNA polymerase II subunit RPB2